jgi:predicted amidohydrolase
MLQNGAMVSPMRVCLIQTDPQFKQENLTSLGQVIHNANADLYVLPELFTIGFFPLASVWPAGAESFPKGPTCQLILRFLGEHSSAVICGILEQDDSCYYNIAAVISNAGPERYRQKCPATAAVWNDHGSPRSLPLCPGDYKNVVLPCGRNIGLMVCHDYFGVDAFFKEYKARGVDCVVLIADSSSKEWLRKFQKCCPEYGLPAIICNSAGSGKGNSCIINNQGGFVPLLNTDGQHDFFSELTMNAIGII